MKKALSIAIIFILALSFASCQSEKTSIESSTKPYVAESQIEERTVAEKSDDGVNTKPSQQDLTTSPDVIESEPIIKDYSYTKNGYTYVVFLVENITNKPVDVSFNVQFYDASGNIIDTADEGIYDLMPNYKDATSATTENLDVTYKYTFDVGNDTFGDSLISSATFTDNMTDEKIIYSVTNNGNEPITYCGCRVLFFKGDNVVYYDFSFIDGDVNATVTKYGNLDLPRGIDFDRYEFIGIASKML